MRSRSQISTLEATRYEIAATKDGQTFTVGFTPRVSRQGLLNAMRAKGDEIIERCAISETDEISFGFDRRGSTSFAFAKTTSGWKIGFTGRTEREVAGASMTTTGAR